MHEDRETERELAALDARVSRIEADRDDPAGDDWRTGQDRYERDYLGWT